MRGGKHPAFRIQNYPNHVPSSQNFGLHAGANAGKYGYFLFISILPSNLLSSWHVFFFLFFFFPESRKLTAYPQNFVPNSNPTPIHLDPESQTDAMTLTPLVLLRPPGRALTRLPGKWKRKCPLMHPSCFSTDFNPLAIWSLLPAMHTVWSGEWKLSVGFSIFNFSFFFFLQTRMHEESGGHWLVCNMSVFIHTQTLMHGKSRTPLGMSSMESLHI